MLVLRNLRVYYGLDFFPLASWASWSQRHSTGPKAFVCLNPILWHRPFKPFSTWVIIYFLHNDFFIAILTKACMWIKPICFAAPYQTNIFLREIVMTVKQLAFTYTSTIIQSVFRLCCLDNPHNIMILLPHKTVLKNNTNIKYQTVLTTICYS